MSAFPNTMATGPSVNEGNIYAMNFSILAADIATGDLLTTFAPGHAFQFVDLIASTLVAVTTGSKLATLTPYIGTVAGAGGVLALTSAGLTPAGAIVKASAFTAGSALNIGKSTDTITLTWSAVTTFIEGKLNIQLRIKNLDVLL